jgi:tetratricopeptide (TPR) repeat protein
MERVQSLVSQGMDLAKVGRRAEAYLLFSRVIALDPENLEAWLWLGALAPEPQKSISFLSKALAIAPESRRAQRGLAWAHERLNLLQQRPRPTRRVGEAIGPGPWHDWVRRWEEIVGRLEASGSPVLAEREGIANENDPTFSFRDLRIRGRENLESGRVGAAILDLVRAADLKPTDAETQHLLGVAFYRAGLLDFALEALTEARGAEGAHIELSELLKHDGRSEEAAHYRQVVPTQRPDARDEELSPFGWTGAD